MRVFRGIDLEGCLAASATPSPTAGRALELLAGSRGGCTEAIMLAHGFSIDLMVELIRAGLASVTTERLQASILAWTSSERPSLSFVRAERTRATLVGGFYDPLRVKLFSSGFLNLFSAASTAAFSVASRSFDLSQTFWCLGLWGSWLPQVNL